jgi:hypothetical protein
MVPCECVECPCTRVISAAQRADQLAAGDDPICTDCEMGDHNEAES